MFLETSPRAGFVRVRVMARVRVRIRLRVRLRARVESGLGWEGEWLDQF